MGCHLKDVKGIGKPEADPDDPDKTKKASIKIHTQDADVKWHLAKDTDADGFITNKDNDTVPKDELDFYSIFKHEIGHTLCFVHAGKTDDAEFGMALPFEESLFPNAEDRS